MDKVEIYSKRSDLTEGIFGECFTWLLEILNHLEKNNKINDNTNIIFNLNTLNNDNVIPKFVVPKQICEIEDGSETTKISLVYYKRKNAPCDFEFHEDSFKKANKIFNKYFKFNDFILNEVEKLNINNKTIGIHYRGTDKQFDKSQATPITKSELLLIIQDYMKNNEVEKIFCCSDEEDFIDKIKILYPNKLIEYKQIRSNNSNNFGFFRNGHRSSSNKKDSLTISCLVDMLALSKCNTVIKTSSALSSFSKIINPSLNLYTVSAMRQPWFPTGTVKCYESDSDIINKILERTMKGDRFNLHY